MEKIPNQDCVLKVPKFNHRPHLDAIRGIACLGVILFHSKFPGLQNGFVGVDIFFVLSGFLISSQLLREIINTGSICLLSFFCRRIRRLFPASAVVLLVTAIVYKNMELPEYVAKHTPTFLASALYYENWYGIKVETDYFNAEGADQSPVVHFWSLSIEEQFYFLYPLIAYCICILCLKNVIFIGFVFTFLGCTFFYINYMLNQDNPMISYFSTWGRIYQFCIGNILACVVLSLENKWTFQSKKTKSNHVDIVSFLMFISFLWIILRYDGPVIYLGFITTCFTFMLFIILEFLDDKLPVKNYFFHNSALRLVGKYSYGMYLIHVPITKFCDLHFWLPLDGVFRGISILFLTFLSSLILSRLVEEPAMKVKIDNVKARAYLIFQFILSTITLVFLLTIILGHSYKFETANFQKNIKLIYHDDLEIVGGTEQETYGGNYSLFILGDSYSRPYEQPFRDMSQKCGITYHYDDRAGMVVLPVHGAKYDKKHQDCFNAMQIRVLEYIETKRPNLTIVFNRNNHVLPLSYKNWTNIEAAKDPLSWKELMYELSRDWLLKITKYTKVVFVIPHASITRENMTCLKRLRNLGKKLENPHEFAQCRSKLHPDGGLKEAAEVYKRLAGEFTDFGYIDEFCIIKGLNETEELWPLVYKGVEIYREDGQHFNEINFMPKRFHVFLQEAEKQSVPLAVQSGNQYFCKYGNATSGTLFFNATGL